MTRRGFSKTPRQIKVRVAGNYRTPSVMSPKQFKHVSSGFRGRVTIGNMQISSTKTGTRFSTGGGGWRSMSGRLSHLSTIKSK